MCPYTGGFYVSPSNFLGRVYCCYFTSQTDAQQVWKNTWQHKLIYITEHTPHYHIYTWTFNLSSNLSFKLRALSCTVSHTTGSTTVKLCNSHLHNQLSHLVNKHLLNLCGDDVLPGLTYCDYLHHSPSFLNFPL